MSGNLGYLFAGYTVIWILFFGYLMTMWRNQRRLGIELRELRQLAEKLTGKG
jgi:CcmD family protein